MKRLVLLIGILLLISSASAAINNLPAGHKVYPDTFIAYAPIDNTTLYPVDTNSAHYINRLAELNSGTSPHIYIYSAYPTNIVNYSTVSPSPQYVTVRSTSACLARLPPVGYAGLFPIPYNVTYETTSEDKIMLLYDPLLHQTWTIYATQNTSMFDWTSCGQYWWDTTNMTARPQGMTSQSASGMPGFPFTIRNDEIQNGEINHALKVSAGRVTGAAGLGTGWVYPAVHQSDWSSVCGADCLPLGLRFRLKSTFDESPYQGSDAESRAALMVIHAMKKYGMILLDAQNNQDTLSISSEKFDTSVWGSTDYTSYTGIHATDFEVIDQSWYILNTDPSEWTWEVRFAPLSPGEPLPNVDANAGHIPTSLSGNAPLTVQFTNISYNYPTLWVWSLKDVAGNNTWTPFSTEENPTYTFGTAGNYLINLTAGNQYGYNITPELAWVNVTALGIVPPVSEFTSDVVTGPDPLTVHFTDMSINATFWNWSFGDGTYSSSQDPMHVFSAGVYTITLLVTNAGGSDTETKGAYIYTTSVTPTPTITPTPTPTPTGNWTATPTPTPTPTPAPVGTTGPQIVPPVTGINSNGANFTVSGITGSNVWLVYGQNSGGYTWITPNTTATSGWATIWLSGSPIFGNTRYYVQACDQTGCGNEVSFSTLAITPMPTTTYGAGYKAITGMR
jgi:PKD repeat protein